MGKTVLMLFIVFNLCGSIYSQNTVTLNGFLVYYPNDSSRPTKFVVYNKNIVFKCFVSKYGLFNLLDDSTKVIMLSHSDTLKVYDIELSEIDLVDFLNKRKAKTDTFYIEGFTSENSVSIFISKGKFELIKLWPYQIETEYVDFFIFLNKNLLYGLPYKSEKYRLKFLNSVYK